MRKMILLAGALLAMSSFSAAATEQGTSYFGLNYNMWDIGVSTWYGSASVEPKSIEGRYGHFVGNNFAIESRLGIGVSDDRDIKVSRHLGIYLKAYANAGAIQPYLMFGLTDLEIEIDNEKESDNDFSYGVGVMFGERSTKFNLEWGRLYSDSDGFYNLDIDVMQLGFITTF